MTLGGVIAGSLSYLQGSAQSLMTDTLIVKRNGPLPRPDVSGVVTPTQTVIYSGKGRVKPMKRITATGVNAGEAKDSELIFIVSIPLTITTVRPGDIVSVVTSVDAGLVAVSLRVVEVERGSQVSARRLTCQLVEARS